MLIYFAEELHLREVLYYRPLAPSFYLFLLPLLCRLLLNDNEIVRIPALGLFNRLPNLQSLDLSRNNIVAIEEGAFEGATSIVEM